MKIAFSGNEKCSISNMLVMALAIHSQCNGSVLLIDASFRKTYLEDAFKGEDNLYIKEEAYYGIKEGMDYMLYRMNTGAYNSSFTKEGVTYITSDFAYVKSAVRGNIYEYRQNFKEHAAKLLDEWSREFDFVMIRCDDVTSEFASHIIDCCDVCVACFEQAQLRNSTDIIYKINKKRHFFIMVGQVIGDLHNEKQFLTRICRINEDKIAYIPYNSFFDVRTRAGRILKFFNSENSESSNSLLVEEFIKQTKFVLHKFRKWLEAI